MSDSGPARWARGDRRLRRIAGSIGRAARARRLTARRRSADSVPVPVAFVLKGYPRLSETFIAQEIRELEHRGLDIRLYSMRLPTDPAVHPVHREIAAPVTYLPEYLHRSAAARTARLAHGAAAAGLRGWHARAWLRDLRRDPTRNRLRRFGQAMVLAAELPAEIGWLHAHFLHTPASVARYAARLRKLPWSASAHAKDVWTTPDVGEAGEARRLPLAGHLHRGQRRSSGGARARAGAGRAALPRPRLHPLPARRRPSGPRRDGSDPSDPAIVLSVGRAVEKKGYAVLLDALARLPPELAWRLVHIGGGPLLDELQRRGADRWLSPIASTGSAPGRSRTCCRPTGRPICSCSPAASPSDGDRDGLPNVLMEAQSQGLACISTTVSAIPELIDRRRDRACSFRRTMPRRSPARSNG